MATTTTSSPLLDLPDDLLLRVLVGVPRADHGATAAACGAFRAVMSGPRFLRLRREFGFAERAVLLKNLLRRLLLTGSYFVSTGAFR